MTAKRDGSAISLALALGALLALLGGACSGGSDGGGTNGDTGVGDAVADIAAPDTGGPGSDTARDTAGVDSGTPADAATEVEGPRAAGAPCEHNSQCAGGFCVLGAAGYECARRCDEGCGVGYACLAVIQTSPDFTYLCVPSVSLVCLPCQDDSQCGGGRCVDVEGAPRCVSPCDGDGGCPADFTCGQPEGVDAPVCLPASGSCECDAPRSGSERICGSGNELGTCYGTEVCDPEAGGWIGCTAPAPAEETCDGVDNDCDGAIDDGLPQRQPCSNTVEGVGTCEGVATCSGALGWVCSAAAPTEEVCDFADNDCDGETDEGFQEGGVYGTAENCGACGVNCGALVRHGESACDTSGALPACVVVSCDPGYYRVSPYECVSEQQLLCQPCAADVHCAGGGCREIGGGRYCTRGCSDEQPCPEGYACVDDGGESVCAPMSGSCDCRVETAGGRRPCNRENELGTCYGVETCDPATGWGGCTAHEPAPESCNGIDDDCNGAVDEGIAATEPCVKDVPGVGTCTGTAACLGSLGWVCDARDPAPERCDHEDDDCDGETDEGFQEGGVYASLEHCGDCATSCVDRIPNAVEACEAAAPGGPRCVAVACEPGFTLWEGRACVLPVAACTPCANDESCYGGECVTLGDGNFCATSCETDACPAGFDCQELPDAGAVCVPANGSCSCAEGNGGAERPCYATNEHGTCWGAELCQPPTGWSDCAAPEAAEETCNGVDDDCDGLVDEELPPGEPCTNEVAGVGTCGGVLTCRGPAGWVCDARTPTPEACNYVDDDCDGAVDEDFTDGDAYALPGDCGMCGNDCAGAIPHGTATCGVVGGGAGVHACVVDACEPGYVALDAFTCVWLPHVQCAPCNDDAECPGAATCETVGDGTFCLVGCGADDACPDGAACGDVDGGRACLPDTGTCDCSAANEGAARLCSVEGPDGTCHGIETCAPGAGAGSGWADCDAPTPAVETCNGRDDDCDGEVDEGLLAGPCEQTVPGVGTCTGTRVCLGGLGWVCDAATPAPEACDFLDNDCDGEVDEDFKVGAAYAMDEHCGTCFATCEGIEVEHGVIGCVVGLNGSAACGAVACDEGLVPINPFQCAAAVPVACEPCQNDANCFGRPCVQVGGSSFCLERCGGGVGCAIGYGCTDVGDEAFCLPPSGTCGCNEDTAGTRRACQVANELGTCTGFELCDPEVGWSGCTAGLALPETCNGVDDDCSGVVDDGLPAGAPCERTNGLGTCDGVEVCLGLAGWVCDAREPASEACDGVDNDCDGAVDGPGSLGCVVYYEDGDEDGAGRDDTGECQCGADDVRTVRTADDCADEDPAVSPFARELCNGVDDDCDGLTDEAGAVGCTAYHADRDHDGWGADADVRCLCEPGGDYTLLTGGDCDDDAPASNPDGTETCGAPGNGDEDCDGEVDEEDAVGCLDYFRDADSDGYGGDADGHCLCAPVAPYTGTVGGDCSDQTAAISPAAPEVCNGFDDDCDGETDEEGATGCAPWYVDADEDGYGAVGQARCLCRGDGTYVTRTDGDCDDDATGVHPDALEVCNGGVDDDCDGETDEVLDEDPALTACTTFHRDDDEDGYGHPTSTACSCGESGPTPFTASNGDDCDDAVATTYLGASEACNGVDDDCDGTTDVGEYGDLEGPGFPIDYEDEDGDGVANCVDPCPVYVDRAPPQATQAVQGTLGHPWPTVQGGLDGAGGCDQVWVYPGTYVENVRFNGRNVRLESVAGPATTILDGNRQGAVVTFDQNEQPPAALVGFTVRNGSGNPIYSLWKEVLADPANDRSGGGIFVKIASPLIQGNVITQNDVVDQGGGILLYASYAHVVGNEISNNIARDDNDCGGGILATNSETLIEDNYVHDNQCTGNSGDGGGLMAYASSDHIRGNVFTANWARNNGSGVRLSYYGEVLFEGNLVYGNNGQGVMVSHGTTGRVLNNTIVGNSTYGLYIYISSGSAYSAPLLANNIIAWNDGCGVSDNSDSPFSFLNNDVYGNGTNFCDNLAGGGNPTGQDGNLSANPRFVTWSDNNNFADDDFHLQAISPCHDTGTDLGPYGIATDHDDNPRPRGTAYDMGAFEIQE